MSALVSAASLGDVIRESFGQFAERPALWVGGRVHTYAELADYATAIAARLVASQVSTARVAIFADRNETAYAGILAALLAGMAYVPLNPRFSAARVLNILQQADVDAIICDARCGDILESIRGQLPSRLAMVKPESGDTAWRSGSGAGFTPRPTTRADTAYIMFTSGTTGQPKGVPISHGNALAFLENMRQRVPVLPGDRFLQLLDLSFDPSLHDLFGCWFAGATLYSAPEGMATMADRFVREFQITHFCAVASTAALLQTQGRLKTAALPSLRETIFGGEALPSGVAAAWQKAAPHSTVRNHYGPTEATVAISECVWQDVWESEIVGSVPIGKVFDGQSVVLLDPDLSPVVAGGIGELLVSGSQVTTGYLNNPELTSERFVSLPGKPGVWYRTGDLADEHPSFGLRYRGRVDQQLKVRGFRVEAEEVESHVRAVSGSDLVAVIGWPRNEDGLVMGLVAFVVTPRSSETELIERCRKRMPDYMVPARVLPVDTLPLNSNGKIDYSALARSDLLA